MAYRETPLLRQSRQGYFGVQAHGKDVFEHYAWISQILETLGKDGFLAKGTLQAGDEIVWVTELEGKPRPFSDLAPQEQSEVMAEIEDSVSLLSEQADKYLADKDREFRQRGRILSEIVGPPNEACIFVVNGKPVIAGWGFREEQAVPDAPRLFAVSSGEEPELQDEPVGLAEDQRAGGPAGPISGSRVQGQPAGQSRGRTVQEALPQSDERTSVLKWVLIFLGLLALLLLILFLLKSCDAVPFLASMKSPTQSTPQETTAPRTKSRPTTSREAGTLPAERPGTPDTEEGGTPARPLAEGPPQGLSQDGPTGTEAERAFSRSAGQELPAREGTRGEGTPALPAVPGPATTRPEQPRSLTGPGSPGLAGESFPADTPGGLPYGGPVVPGQERAFSRAGDRDIASRQEADERSVAPRPLPGGDPERPEQPRSLGSPGSPRPESASETQRVPASRPKVKKVSERLIEGTKVLSIDPPDPDATWHIKIPAGAPAEVLQDKAGYLRFLGSDRWDEARGREVKIRFSAPAGGRSFTADVIARDSQGFETVYVLTVGGK
ncbi:MAG: hypothetical protein AB1646_06225 [Thermodesulfobacteriota bacterium]